ncbi:phosphatase PAP2 family protein [Legionella feeleii]|uniref:Inositolphosphotransferase Aur1/Ipt1 domain-containing protein n=1 Tax=Legionella feeleii TaxID=453 RepID=A0A0W0TIP2_9GAMM|nr:phosphatase PAP2 family protein [Legionella feeleii]KTC95387.1 hypothetical protein Lfee_3052 [Legionella feeleii]SPX59968.1 Uncharacterised protein [Legionella feeleii]
MQNNRLATPVQDFAKYCPIITAFIICSLAIVAYAVNFLFYRFPGNNYFPPSTSLIAIVLLLAMIGGSLQFGKHGRFVRTVREIFYFFLVLVVIAFATNAVQYTPFQPIDKQLIAIEASLGINMQAIVAWTANHPRLQLLLAYIYDSLHLQMSILPLAVIIAGKFSYIREHYCLLLVTVLIGFTLYYYLPTMGPASFIPSPYFMAEQHATGIKFTEIHRYIQPSTIEGGMIAMPSFHAIWAWLCLYLVRCWPIVFILLLPINVLLLASCILLGWHYPIDLLGSFLILLPAHGLYFYYKKKTQKFCSQ